jgi:hypothetical protein
MSEPMGHPEDFLDEKSQKKAVELVKCQDQDDRTWRNVRHEQQQNAV